MSRLSQAIVLDASALIASIYEEPGCQVVDKHLPHAVISSVNFTEVASYMVRNGTSIEEVSELLQDLTLNVEDYDENQALIAAGLLKKTASKGLSLGDRACLALALSRKLPVLTGDKVWSSIDVGLKIELIR
jgi:ribonuclease VapC